MHTCTVLGMQCLLPQRTNEVWSWVVQTNNPVPAQVSPNWTSTFVELAFLRACKASGESLKLVHKRETKGGHYFLQLHRGNVLPLSTKWGIF